MSDANDAIIGIGKANRVRIGLADVLGVMCVVLRFGMGTTLARGVRDSCEYVR
jgi:hypothetical protein